MIAIFSQPDNNSPDTPRLDNNTDRSGELLSQNESWQRGQGLSSPGLQPWMTVSIFQAVIQSASLRITYRSKDDLYSELHVECLSWANPGSAIEVTNSVTDQPESAI